MLKKFGYRTLVLTMFLAFLLVLGPASYATSPGGQATSYTGRTADANLQIVQIGSDYWDLAKNIQITIVGECPETDARFFIGPLGGWVWGLTTHNWDAALIPDNIIYTNLSPAPEECPEWSFLEIEITRVRNFSKSPDAASADIQIRAISQQ